VNDFGKFSSMLYRQGKLYTGNISILNSMPRNAKVFLDKEEIVRIIRQFQANTTKFWGACVDSTLPSFSTTTVKQGYIDAKHRGVNIMYITEITKENLLYCKEIMRYGELRHLDGVMGNFAISDTEYIAGVKRGNMLVSLLWTDIKELIDQQRYVFDTLWKHALPADKRLEEIDRNA
jgi:hypothetical protein